MSLFSSQNSKGYHVSKPMILEELEKYLNTLPSNATIVQIVTVGMTYIVVHKI